MTEVVMNRAELAKLLTDFEYESTRQAPGFLQFRLKAFNQKELLWEYNGSTGEIACQKIEELVDIFEMCGATKLVASFSGKLGKNKLENPHWKEWFLSRALD